MYHTLWKHQRPTYSLQKKKKNPFFPPSSSLNHFTPPVGECYGAETKQRKLWEHLYPAGLFLCNTEKSRSILETTLEPNTLLKITSSQELEFCHPSKVYSIHCKNWNFKSLKKAALWNLSLAVTIGVILTFTRTLLAPWVLPAGKINNTCDRN